MTRGLESLLRWQFRSWEKDNLPARGLDRFFFLEGKTTTSDSSFQQESWKTCWADLDVLFAKHSLASYSSKHLNDSPFFWRPHSLPYLVWNTPSLQLVSHLTVSTQPDENKSQNAFLTRRSSRNTSFLALSVNKKHYRWICAVIWFLTLGRDHHSAKFCFCGRWWLKQNSEPIVHGTHFCWNPERTSSALRPHKKALWFFFRERINAGRKSQLSLPQVIKKEVHGTEFRHWLHVPKCDASTFWRGYSWSCAFCFH